MIARNLPKDTIVVTNLQDRTPVLNDWSLPLHMAYDYQTIYITQGEGTFAHERIAVNTNARLENLADVARAFKSYDEIEREADFGVDKDTPEGLICDCDVCRDLKQFV